MHVTDELFLPEGENIESRVFSSYPQHAAPILVDRENGITVKAIRVGIVVLKPVCETSYTPVKVKRPCAEGHPQSNLPVSHKLAIKRTPARCPCQRAASTGAKWI